MLIFSPMELMSDIYSYNDGAIIVQQEITIGIWAKKFALYNDMIELCPGGKKIISFDNFKIIVSIEYQLFLKKKAHDQTNLYKGTLF